MGVNMGEISISKVTTNKISKSGKGFKIISIFLIISLICLSGYLKIENNDLKSKIYCLQSQITELQTEYTNLKAEHDAIFKKAPNEYTAVSVVYYTKFGEEKHIMTFSVPYDLYKYYHEIAPHPSIRYTLKEGQTEARQYITPNEQIIQNIVSEIKMQTNSEEELANALLDFVQDKGHVLSIRYYPTFNYKYPIETLVEMGGDCDTHAFLYATLLKAAGFKVLLLFSSEINHAAVAVHLETSPQHSTQKSVWYFTYNGLKYYYAETTGWGRRVGDLPEEWQGAKWYLIEV